MALVWFVSLLVAACGSVGAGRPPLPSPPHTAAQGATVAQIRRAGVLRVAADLSDPPLAFRAGGVPDGFEIDLVGLLAAALGVRLEVIDTPRARLRSGLGDADLSIGGWTADAAPGPVSTPYYVLRQAILWGEGQEVPVGGSLRGVRAAVQAGSRGEAVAGQMGAVPAVLVYEPLQALAAVSRGDAQAAVADFPLVAEYVRTHRHLRMSPGPGSAVPLVVVTRPGAPDLLAFVSASIQELDQRGGLTQLRQRWHL